MKLLTTIAAVLLSISAYSQDLIEYENGTFTQNGEELSMEQIDDLTLLHKAGKGNVRRGNRFDLKYNDIDLLIDDNALNALGGVASGAAGGYLGFWGLIFTAFDIPVIGVPLLAGGTGLCVVSFKAFSRIASSPEECLRKRDKQFNKVADKLNQKVADKLNRGIKAANQ